jgi:hypothetical protein
MDTLITVSSIHQAVTLSVPYDMTNIIQAFYSHYSNYPTQEPCEWGEEFHTQKRFMTLEQVFTYLSLKTANIPERYAILDRMIGHMSVITKLPYDDVHAAAYAIFQKNNK